MANYFSFSDPLNSGIDFYTADDFKLLDAALSVESSVTVTSQKISFSSIQISSDASTATIASKISYAAADLSGILDVTLAAAFERQDALIPISGEVLLSVNIEKISFTQIDQNVNNNSSDISINVTKIAISGATLSGDASVANTVIQKTALASSQISSSVDAVTVIQKIMFAESSMSSSVTLSVFGRIFLTTIRINILNNTNINSQMIRFSTNVVSDDTLIRSLLLLDNKALTNQSRNLSVSAAPKFIENTNWQGDTSRYYKNSANSKGSKRTFNIDWSFIPNKSSFTVDLQESRDFLKQVSQDSDVHSLTIINQDVNGVTPYTEEDVDVFITSYSETLIRRDLSSESYYFSCNMVLEEA